MSKYVSWALFFLSFFLFSPPHLFKSKNCPWQLLANLEDNLGGKEKQKKKSPLFWHNYLCTKRNSDPLWAALAALSAPVNKLFLKVWKVLTTSFRKENESVKRKLEWHQLFSEGCQSGGWKLQGREIDVAWNRHKSGLSYTAMGLPPIKKRKEVKWIHLKCNDLKDNKHRNVQITAGY